MQNVTMQRKAYSIKTTAEQIDASVPFVRLEIRRGKLRAKKLGKKVVILDSDLETYLNGQQDWSPASEKPEIN